MDQTKLKVKKHGDRIEKRKAYVTEEIDWLEGKENWPNMTCIGAVNTRFETPDGISDEWHYYISSKKLSADDLLKHTRFEWGVESMHWILDVHFEEDKTRSSDKNTQQNLNMVRKTALNMIRNYKNKLGSKRSISEIMRNCLFDNNFLLNFIRESDLPFVTNV